MSKKISFMVLPIPKKYTTKHSSVFLEAKYPSLGRLVAHTDGMIVTTLSTDLQEISNEDLGRAVKDALQKIGDCLPLTLN